MLDYLMGLLYTIPGVIIALSFHEWGHAYAAWRMGDPTARNLGRLTLNPLAHIDPVGFLMMVLVGFGWAKPVPVNPRNYKSYRKGELVVSLAGVTMNLLLATVAALVLAAVLYFKQGTYLSGSLITALNIIDRFILLNLALVVFNLLPIYPLDGYHVFEVLFSKRLGPSVFQFLRTYGQYMLIAVLLFGRFGGFSPVGFVAGKAYDGLLWLVFTLFGLN